jgi:hypothetical protein
MPAFERWKYRLDARSGRASPGQGEARLAPTVSSGRAGAHAGEAALTRLGRRWRGSPGRGPQQGTRGTGKARGRRVVKPALSAFRGAGLRPAKAEGVHARRF